MNTKKKLLVFTIICCSFIFCKTKKVNETNMQENKLTTTNKKITTDKVYNFDKSKVLILKYIVDKNPIIKYNYKVIDVKTQKELKEGVFTGDKIEWLDNNTLKCTPYVGMVKKDDDRVLENTTKNNVNFITIKVN
ncbi:hypothetical protein [Polaribacter sp.]|uniref:hypothetical protein n=1 Tax=Polaribacter sp. TaxID=1920175 RepID=UPI003F6AA2C6